jgi:hypothetical protein
VTWGFAEPGELEAAHPDRIVSTVAELAAALGVVAPGVVAQPPGGAARA